MAIEVMHPIANNGFCLAIKTAIGHQDVGVRIDSEEVAEGLNGDDRAGDVIFFAGYLLKEDLQQMNQEESFIRSERC